LGQRRATQCPICGSKDITNWTCPPCTEIVNVHRELIRNLQSWRSLYEALEAPDVLIGPDGRDYSLWDVQRFYETRTTLPPRMSQAITLCLFQNLKERDAAVAMGISASNPVSEYATIGLTTLIARAYSAQHPEQHMIQGEPHRVAV
jgi:hypothetical protein